MRTVLIGVVTGVLGFALAWSAWHLYVDHQNFHRLLDYVVQAQAHAGGATK